MAGLLALLRRAWPGYRRAAILATASLAGALLIVGVEYALDRSHDAAGAQPVLVQILVFFTKAGSFVFGSGLAIVPFLEQGVVHDFGWLTEHQFLDAVAVALITPGPVVITVAFIGYLVAGVAGRDAGGDRHLSAGLLLHHRPGAVVQAAREDHLQLRAFADGATAASSGAIAGAVVVLGPPRDCRRSDHDRCRRRASSCCCVPGSPSRSWSSGLVSSGCCWPVDSDHGLANC